ncbi:MAG TPA: hypothetical protein VH593_01100, partial [Ktedonobacteraceae bacterium]
GTASSGSSTTTTPSTPPAVNGYGTSNGCPSNAVVNSTSSANVTERINSPNQSISAHNGDMIEIQFPFGRKWTGPSSTPSILQLQQPSGYAQKTNNVCVWRFVAKGTGKVQLDFEGRPLCKPSEPCPMYIVSYPITINIQ